jgi:antitoxin VapB
MTIYVKDEATSKAVRKLAKIRGTTLTDAIHSAVKDALAHETSAKKRGKDWEALKALQAEIAKYPKTGLKADKAFYDELSGDI